MCTQGSKILNTPLYNMYFDNDWLNEIWTVKLLQVLIRKKNINNIYMKKNI